MGGSTGSEVDTIEYVQIASTGDAIDFGDLNGSARRRGLAYPTVTEGYNVRI